MLVNQLLKSHPTSHASVLRLTLQSLNETWINYVSFLLSKQRQINAVSHSYIAGLTGVQMIP